MANPLDRRRNLLDDNDYKSKFDYKKFDIINGDELFLIDLEQKIKNNQIIFVKANLEIGNLLAEAQNRLKEYGTGTFMKWYENLGFNKDSVSYFLKRYELSLVYPNKREYIAEMPVRLVKELTKKDVEIEIVEDAIKNEIKSTKELSAIKLSYSHSANIEETRFTKNRVTKQEIIDFIKSGTKDKLIEEEVNNLVKNFFNIYKISRR